MQRSVRHGTKVACALLALGILPGKAPGQQQPVCETTEAFHQFDFWVGEWDVYNNVNGNLAGHNRIESAEGGCVLVEHWNGSSGGTGMSLNYYDSVTGKWRQVWVANGYSIDIEGGLTNEGAMLLEGQLHNYRREVSFEFKGTWTPNEDGTVRQLFEQKNPQTGQWQVWFDGRYERRQ